MKVDTMRWIDRCVGAPLCALVTPLVRLWHIARARPPRTAPRLLFVELSEGGQHHPGRVGHAKGTRSAGRGAILRHLPPQRRLARSGRNDLAGQYFHDQGHLAISLGLRLPGIPGLDTAQGDRHRRRPRIVFALHGAARGLVGRLPPRGILSFSQRGSLSRRNVDASRRL